jgi:hypothetical protein
LNKDIFCTDTNNNICEFVGGNAKATEEITVPDGTFGDIKLLLCTKCVLHFSNVTFLRIKNNEKARLYCQDRVAKVSVEGPN